MPPAPRRTREIAWTRDDILAAAERAFARSGYEATTMQDIATEAGYTVPSLYAYFDGKQLMFDALLTRLDDEYAALFDCEDPAGLSFRQQLELMLGRLLELTERRRCALAVFMASPGHGKRKLTGFERAVGSWGRWLKAVASPADLGGHRVEDAATALVGMVNAFYLMWMTQDPGTGLQARASVIVELFLHGLEGRRK
jgi:AcrR family transcriptional regulator